MAKSTTNTNTSGADDKIQLSETDALLPKQWLSGSLKYTDFKAFAEGGTAELQTAVDKNLKRVVVFKTLHPHLADDEGECRRFLREARVTAMIPHPGTVPVYELGRTREGNLFFTMKRLNGRDMRTILMELAAKSRQVEAEFPLPKLIDIVISACQTLSFAHVEGVVHRDLKPANVLVGQFGEVTVLDWGLAKLTGDKPPEDLAEMDVKVAAGKDAIQLELTRAGARYGTPLYMSPEQARGDAELDERTDVYNMGIILYECLTTKNLVWGNQLDDVLDMILNKPTPIPSENAPDDRDVPPELEAICLRALAKDPDQRYLTINQLAEDLIRYRSHERVSVYGYGWRDQFQRWKTRHQITLTAALAGLVGAVLFWLIQVLTGL